MHVHYEPNGLNTTMSGLGKFKRKKKPSRKDTALDKLAADLDAAFALADSPEGTEEDAKNAERLQVEYNAIIASFESRQKKKDKGFIGKLRVLKRKEFKLLAKLKVPSFGTHYKHEQRKLRAKQIKVEVLKVRGEKPSPERDAKLAALSAEMMDIAKKEKKYLKQGSIIATIVTIVVGVFTFGGGAVAVQGAFQAIKQGAITLAKRILMAAIMGALKKGSSKKDTNKAIETVNDLEKYPPDPNLPTLDAMLKDSQAKKLDSQEKRPGLLIPAGIIAALTLLR